MAFPPFLLSQSGPAPTPSLAHNLLWDLEFQPAFRLRPLRGAGRGLRLESDAVCDVDLDDVAALPVVQNRKNHEKLRPWSDEIREIDRQRNRIDRAFAKAEPLRRFATRHDEHEGR